jgi:hypothetical protein
MAILADPLFGQAVMERMIDIFENGDQLRISVHATAIFERTRALTRRAHGIRTRLVPRQDALETNLVIPIVPKVVIAQSRFTFAAWKSTDIHLYCSS